MKSVLFFLLVGFAVSLVLTQAFRNNFEKKIEAQVNLAVSSSTLAAPPTVSSTPKVIPAGPSADTFHGPVGKPYIIGPSGPPPNY